MNMPIGVFWRTPNGRQSELEVLDRDDEALPEEDGLEEILDLLDRPRRAA